MRGPIPRELLDATLFALLLVAMLKDWTGLVEQQWLGLGVTIHAIWHFGSYWTWTSAVARRMFVGITARARLCYIVDAALCVCLLVVSLFGLGASTRFGVPFAEATTWNHVHVSLSLAVLLLAGTKIGLHWRWVGSVARRWLTPAPPGETKPNPVGVAEVRADSEWRDFPRLVAIVGAASLMAAIPALHKVRAQQSQSGSRGLADVLTRTSSGSSGAVSGAQCNQQCSFPGRCRRYSDADGNGRCTTARFQLDEIDLQVADALPVRLLLGPVRC